MTPHPDPIDDALRTFPSAPPPPGLSANVMRRIRTLAPAPRFRLYWLDYAIGLVGAGTLALALTFWHLIPSQFMQSVRYRVAFLIEQYSQTAAWPVLAGGLVFAALALGGLAFVFLLAALLSPPRTR